VENLSIIIYNLYKRISRGDIMEKEIEKQFSKEILYEAAGRFGLVESSLKQLGAFENYVYEGQKDGISYILRLTHSSHRNTNMVLGELDWINFLSTNGVMVSKSLPSCSGNLAEEIYVEADYFIVTLFEKAEGKLLDSNDSREWSADIFKAWGNIIGKMHKATKKYEVPNDKIKRPQWNEDDLLDLEKYIPKDHIHIIEIGNKLLNYFDTLPKDKDCYGLIHTDIHAGNFFVHNEKITVFDFDDCSYQWFISDIAIALYYSVWSCCDDKTTEEKKQFSQQFLQAFLDGYNLENKLNQFWINQIPYFLKLRDLNLYAVLHKKWDLDNLNEKQIKLLNEIKKRIENQVSIV